MATLSHSHLSVKNLNQVLSHTDSLMENLSISIQRNPSQITKRSQWKRHLIELNGKLRRDYIHDTSSLLMKSYSEIGVYRHRYYTGQPIPCSDNYSEFNYFSCPQSVSEARYALKIMGKRWIGIANLEFDTKGIYLATATRSGCLTVYNFESLYRDDEAKQLMHISVSSGINVVRWNPANQDEVACALSRCNEVRIFDIGYISSKPIEVLRKSPTISYGGSELEGLFDIALVNDGSRVLASDTYGTISIWDRRASDLPQTGLTTNSNNDLISIQVKGDHCVYGASKDGFIYTWDLRGGRSSSALKSDSEIHSSPLKAIKLTSLLTKIEPLKAQSKFIPEEIHSININPSCPYQLGFHLDAGWSGVLNMHNFQVSHIHRPRPIWGSNDVLAMIFQMKPSWIPEHSIYAVGSTSRQGVHLLDFSPNTCSPCHVNYDDSKSPKETFKDKQNGFVPLSKCVTACATHPINGTIAGGAAEGSLLVISQKHRSFKEEDDGGVEHP